MKTLNNYIFVKKIEKENTDIIISDESDIIQCEIIDGNKKGTKVLVHSYMLEAYADGYFCLEEDLVAEV
jgi:hypothetical protein